MFLERIVDRPGIGSNQLCRSVLCVNGSTQVLFSHLEVIQIVFTTCIDAHSIIDTLGVIQYCTIQSFHIGTNGLPASVVECNHADQCIGKGAADSFRRNSALPQYKHFTFYSFEVGNDLIHDLEA